MLKYKLVIFDFDGTLFETQDAISYATKETFIRMNHVEPDEKLLSEVISQAKPLKEQILLLLPALINDVETLHKYIATYRGIYDNGPEVLTRTTAFAGVLDLILLLYTKGVKMAIVSNKDGFAIKKSLDHYSILKYFDIIVGSETHLNKKPDAMIFKDLIYPQFNYLDLSEALMVGDTEVDMLFAKNSGIKSCFALYGHGDNDTLSIKPDHMIRKFQDLEHIVI